jgi:hypothetical protein
MPSHRCRRGEANRIPTGAFPGGLHPKHLGAIGRDQFRGEMIANIAKRLSGEYC